MTHALLFTIQNIYTSKNFKINISQQDRFLKYLFLATSQVLVLHNCFLETPVDLDLGSASVLISLNGSYRLK